MDFIETITLTGQRQYILAAIEHTTRRIQILGTTAHPTADWVTQTIKNLVTDVQDVGIRGKFLIRDRDTKYPALIDEILADAGIRTVLPGVRMPRMNSITERWVCTLRRELLDRTLILERAAPTPRPTRLHAYELHSAPAPPPTARTRANRQRPHTPTRPPRRRPPQVLACCVTCMVLLSGTHTTADSTETMSRRSLAGADA
ncbi:hypothetical protein [Streptomyces sp. NPDC059349]|uniref:hypothetical protein n=1 Tax=Streptomyces sp. NPDC059349 TaxID=3346808 RepID=UPI00367D5416